MSWAYCLPTGFAGYQILRHTAMPLAIPPDGKKMIGQDELTVVVQGAARGWGSVVTYFFMLYFAVLLIHRQLRDDAKCKEKYGKDWEVYRKKVPYRIVPYIY